jgi:DNA-binding GntR family transcriptional regulator
MTAKRAETLNERVYHQIKAKLVSGAFPPGQPLTIRGLAGQLGTGLMPVREALNRLAAARALVPGARRSFVVPKLTHERLEELVNIRAELEGLATELTAANILPRECNRLEVLNKRMSEAAKAGDRDAYFRNNQDFHWLIYEASGSQMLIDLIDELWLHHGPIQAFAFTDPTIFIDGTQRHQQIIDRLRAGDGASARRAMEHDIRTSAAYVARNLARVQAQPGDAVPCEPFGAAYADISESHG